MLLENFLKQVLPSEGYKCWVEIDKTTKKATQGLVQTIEELAFKLKEIDSRGVDAYFACASYLTDRNRRAGNALGAKAFWLDVDAGEGKPYATAEDAISACDDFCNRLRIDLPGIVTSGGGIHAYWCLDRTLTPQEWHSVALRLKLLTASHGFHADPSRTADIASILRPPGSKNYKLAAARPVEVDDETYLTPHVSDEFIEKIINNPCEITPQIHKPAVNAALTAGINVSKAFDATKGMTEGEGRNNALAKYAGELLAKGWQIEDVVKECWAWNQKNTPPLDQREFQTTVHSIARRHAEKHPAPASVIPPTALPALPRGYKWGNANELLVAIAVEIEGETTYEWRIVSHLPVYLRALLNAEGHAQKNSYLFVQYHPTKGWQEFALNSEQLNGPGWYTAWFENGGTLVTGADKYFKTYVREAENMLRQPGTELKRYSQFGWKDDDKSFLVGEHLVRADGSVEKAYGTDKLTPLMKAMSPAKNGNLRDWTQAANKLGTPGMEAHLFMLLASFAAPLMKFCVDEGNGGSILSVISEDSGHGKTPMATAIASVWGELAATVVTGNFTENRRIEDLVRHCHLPQVQEEMAYSDPLLAAMGVEKFTSGTDRGRLTQGGVASGMPERYQTILISLSNKSLYELVRMVNVPMSRRVFEIEIDRPSDELISNLGGVSREMMRNCGHAGLQFIRYIANPQVHQFITDQLTGSNLGGVGAIQQKYRDLLKSRPEHRFIVWPLAAIEVAARILNHYQILQFDVDRIMKWALEAAAMRTIGTDLNEGPMKLHAFMSENINHCLTVQGPYQRGKGAMMPIKVPHGHLAMRYELKDERLFIDQKSLQKWCAKNNISFIGLGKTLAESGLLLTKNKLVTLAAGTELPSLRTHCWEIDMSDDSVMVDIKTNLTLVKDGAVAPAVSASNPT